jgi:hypothetical protein
MRQTDNNGKIVSAMAHDLAAILRINLGKRMPDQFRHPMWKRYTYRLRTNGVIKKDKPELPRLFYILLAFFR